MASTRDRQAAALLRTWRIGRGLSPEQLAWQLAVTGRGHVSGRQVRRIEQEGIVPTARVMFALATYFDTTPDRVWRCVAQPAVRAAA
jgi:transcriptional regulator with XRE-family HTH domain